LSLYQHEFCVSQQKGKRYGEKGEKRREKKIFFILKIVYEDQNIKIKSNSSFSGDRNNEKKSTSPLVWEIRFLPKN
jgi:hypothetical protein